MGAGARFAAERDRWPEHWRVADLDQEEDLLLEHLQPSEELRAVVPGVRSTADDGQDEVLVGVTDRRVVLVGRGFRSATAPLRVTDITTCAAAAPRDQRVLPHIDGDLSFDIDEDSFARVWAQIDDLSP